MARLLFLAFALVAGGARADAAAELAARLQAIESLAARFTQRTVGPDGALLESLSGRLWLARPARIRWHADAPGEQLLVGDGTWLWYYDVELAQVTVRRLDALEESPALLLLGSEEALAAYQVEAQRRGEARCYRLRPRSPEASYRAVVLCFRGARPAAMELEDGLGNRTTVRFSQVALNRPLEESLFHFSPPEGVDVVREP